MTQINNGGSAFPTAKVSINGEVETDGVESCGPGMSLRDWFAGQAVTAAISGHFSHYGHESHWAYDEIADFAYDISDAMLNARAQQPAPQRTERERVLEERLQAIIDWADLAMKNADEFDSHGVRNLDGPVFDAARAALDSTEHGSASV